MALGEPPGEAGALAGLPAEPLRGRTLHRVWRMRGADGAPRSDPWWFASVPAHQAQAGGRFDLPAPMGTCYLASTAVGSLLEALQMHLVNLPVEELVGRRRAEVIAPAGAPPAAKLTAQSVAGQYGITAELWAGRDRSLSHRWALALRRDGWWALYAGLAHDPSGRLRTIALFDHTGVHPPTAGGTWEHTISTLHDDNALHAELARYGVDVRGPGQLPFADPPV